MDIKIAVATHKEYWMPINNIYLPVHAGSENKESIGYHMDNTGTNISTKNANYCELTVLYWLWKNYQADYKGLVHYRRHFTTSEIGCIKYKKNNILDEEQWEKLLKKFPVVVPNKRCYYIESNYSHYIHAHHREGLDLAGEIIKNDFPAYVPAWEKVMNRTWAHMFNMFVMRSDYFDRYCKWLFDILFKVEKKLDISSYDVQEARVFGYISELLLDVWLETNNIKYVEQRVTFLENQNWLKKGGNFLFRKFVGKR